MIYSTPLLLGVIIIKYLYEKIYQDLKHKIDSGFYKPGEKLPTEKELMKIYDASRDTVRKSLQLLANENMILRKAGIGTFVEEKKATYELATFDGFSEQMRRAGLEPSSEIIAISLSSDVDPKIKSVLDLEDKDLVYKISRNRLADDVKMAYEETYIPYKITPNIHEHINEHASLFKIYEDIYHIQIQHGYIELEATLPNKKVQRLLDINADQPVLKMSCYGVKVKDEPLYYVDCWYLGNKYKFTTMLPR